MTEKNRGVTKHIGKVLAIILVANVVFLGLNYYYNSTSQHSYFLYAETINQLDPDSNFLAETRSVPTVVQFYTRSIISIFIQPIMMFLVISIFANYTLIRRVNFLEKQVNEIKEKLDV